MSEAHRARRSHVERHAARARAAAEARLQLVHACVAAGTVMVYDRETQNAMREELGFPPFAEDPQRP